MKDKLSSRLSAVLNFLFKFIHSFIPKNTTESLSWLISAHVRSDVPVLMHFTEILEDEII